MRTFQTVRSSMIDRIEEYRRDWVSGPVRPPRKLPTIKKPLKAGGLSLVLLVMVLLPLSEIARTSFADLKKAIVDDIKTTYTGLEMASCTRLLRQYYLSNQKLPPRPEDYLKGFLRKNKPYSVGNDFWGHPYRVEQYVGGWLCPEKCGTQWSLWRPGRPGPIGSLLEHGCCLGQQVIAILGDTPADRELLQPGQDKRRRQNPVLSDNPRAVWRIF